jgi:cation diffusion facilitator family transporter
MPPIKYTSSHHHGHTHGAIDSSITTNDRGLWAVKWSFIILALTCFCQVIVFYFSNSIDLLADAIHNIGDATTAIPLAIAFTLGKLKPNKRFTYGYGRIEDLAGLAVILTVFISGVIAGYEAINRFFHPEIVKSLKAVMAAALIGFIGNEVVAVFRIKVGKEINSAALIADGYQVLPA